MEQEPLGDSANASASSRPAPVPTQVRVEQFEERFLDAVTVYFQMYVFKDSLYVWVGENPAYLSNMNVAFPTKLEPLPSVSTVLGNHAEGTAKRFSMPITLSYGIKARMDLLEEWVEKRLRDRLDTLLRHT